MSFITDLFKNQKKSEADFKKNQLKQKEKYGQQSQKENKQIPEEKDLNERFEKLLRYKGYVGNDKNRLKMLQLPKEEKWKMILVHEKTIVEQEGSFKIKEAPEFFIHSLRENPTVENLQTLQKTIKRKDEGWVRKILELGCLTVLFEVLVSSTENQLNEKTEEKKEKSFHLNVQSECLHAIRVLMNHKSGMEAFITSEKSVEMISRSLDSSNEKTKTQVFLLLSTVCHYSEEGFFMALDVVNAFKNLKREKTRFETIVQWIKAYEPSKLNFILTCMMFINTLISSTGDKKQKKLLKSEFKSLELIQIVENLKKTEKLDDNLMIQLGVFEEEMDYGEDDDDEDENQDINNLDNPMEILKLIRIQLSGTDAFHHFISILQQFLIISGKSTVQEKIDNMKVLENIIRKAILNSSNSGSLEEVSVKELQLTDRILAQQKNIEILEANMKKISELVQSGKIDKDMVQQFQQLSNTNIQSSTRTVTKIGAMEDKELEKEAEEALKKFGGGSTTDNLLVKNLEAEVKYLNYKLKQLSKELPKKEEPKQQKQEIVEEEQVVKQSNEKKPEQRKDKVEEVKEEEKKEDTPIVAPKGPPGPPRGPPGGPPGAPGMSVGPKLPALPNIKASKPMKGIFWNAISNKQISNSVWVKKDLIASLKDVEINIEEVEELFGQKKKEEQKKEEKVVVQKVQIVEPKKAQNASIILGSMRLRNEEICKAILRLNDDTLKQEQIKSLRDICPSGDEISQIQDYVNQGNSEEILGTTERYFISIAKIPRLEQRLSCWMFKNQFPNQFITISPDIETVKLAIQELMSSEKFLKFCQIVLQMGNFLNSGKKGIFGFQINSLLKLKELKATGTKITLLGYLIQFCDTKYPGILDFKKDLLHVPGSSRVNLQQSKTEIIELKKGIQMIEKEVELSEPSNQDSFRSVMGSFLHDASDKLDLLEKGITDIEKSQKDLSIFYGEDESKFQLSQFLSQIDEVKNEMERKKELEEKKKEAEKKRENKKNATTIVDEEPEEKVDKKKKKKKKEEEEDQGVVDELQNDLLDGSAFKKNKQKKKVEKIDESEF